MARTLQWWPSGRAMRVIKVDAESRTSEPRSGRGDVPVLDLSLFFLPEALASLTPTRVLDDGDRRLLNQIRAAGYVHLFDLFETALSVAVRERAHGDFQVAETLAPLLRLDVFDHHEFFRAFEVAFANVFPVTPEYITETDDLSQTFAHASPLALLVFALHLKLMTQQHYLACVRGDGQLEPHFVKLLKDHWTIECGTPSGRERRVTSESLRGIQHALAHALPGRLPAALRDYRLIVFACDDVLRSQAELDADVFGAARGRPVTDVERSTVVSAQGAAYRKIFLTIGIVNAAFVYSTRNLGPTAPAMLAGIVSALGHRP